MIPTDPPYLYRATVLSVSDGDTITCMVELGFHTVIERMTFRLLHLDTPEMRGETLQQARKAKQELSDMILGKKVLIHTVKDKKGADTQDRSRRYLAEVYIDSLDVNSEMLKRWPAYVDKD